MSSRGVFLLGLLICWAAIIYWPSQMDAAFIASGQTSGSPVYPQLTSVSPSFIESGSGDTTIILNGSSFTSGSVAYGSGNPLSTQYLSSTTLTALVPASMLTEQTELNLQVRTPGYAISGIVQLGVGQMRVNAMEPAFGAPGTTFIARLEGNFLDAMKSLSFAGSGVTATVLPSSVPTVIAFARISIASDAALGPRSAYSTSSYATAVTPSLLTIIPSAPPSESEQSALPIPDVENGPVRTGYIVVVSDDIPTVTATMGMVQNGSVVSQTAILGVSPEFTETIFTADQLPAIGRGFGVAIVNTTDTENDVNVTMLDQNGIPVADTAVLSLAAFGQTARYLSELFPAASSSLFRGTVSITSSQPFAALGLKLEGETLSPVAGSASLYGANASTPLQSLPGTPYSAVIIPQFALGGGWATQLSIINPTAYPFSGRVGFFDPNGNPLAVNMNGSSQSIFSFSLPVGGTFVLAPRDANGHTPF